MADEFTLVARGTEFDKEQWMQNLQRSVALEPVQFFNARVHVYGHAAMMLHRCIRRYTLYGTGLSGECFLTDVWLRRAGRWQVARRQSSPIARTDEPAQHLP